MSELKITSLAELKKYSKGQVVELPPFADGQPFVARIRRPALMDLVRTGRIPNALLSSANTLFSEGTLGFDVEDEDMLSQMFGVIDIICESSFVEPTYQEIKDSGVKLTDEQLMFIFNYSQNGLKNLESFRKE